MTRAPNTARAESPLTSSLWAASSPAKSFPTLDADRSVDVVIVGAGITGLLTATLAAQSGASVLVVDRYGIGGIATRNTTAKISALQGTTYRSITKHRGTDAAAAYAAAQLHAVRGLRDTVERLGTDCGLADAPAYTYATESDSASEAREEFEAARGAGLPVEWTTTTELPFAVEGAVVLADQMHFDPVAFCAGVAEALGPDAIAEHTGIAGVEENKHGVEIVTETGHRVTAEHVVLASQAPFVDPALLANRCTPMQSYCLSARFTGAVPAGMYLSCDQSVRSIRPAVFEGDEIAVVGGAGHHMGEDDASPARWDTLAGWADEHFGPVEVLHRWATHDLTPTDHVPFIGRLTPRADRRWVATGFAKWGMTNGYVAAHLLTETIAGRSVDWADVFDATRIASTITSELASVGKTVVTHLIGANITNRDAPRCTHQGCVLTPDDALGTWDCPCHGSRFSTDGAVVQGPANRRLRRSAQE